MFSLTSLSSLLKLPINYDEQEVAPVQVKCESCLPKQQAGFRVFFSPAFLKSISNS